jgi:hypothetical protein
MGETATQMDLVEKSTPFFRITFFVTVHSHRHGCDNKENLVPAVIPAKVGIQGSLRGARVCHSAFG